MQETLKILVVRFSSIGDIVLTTPVVRMLKKQLNAQVHYLTKSSYVSLLKNNPYIDLVYQIENSISEVIADLKKEKYDYVIDLHSNLRTQILKFRLGMPAKSFNKLNMEKFMLTNFKLDNIPKIHIVDRYLETVKHLGVKNDNQGLDFFLSANDKIDISIFPKNYIVFVIGGQHATKILPNHRGEEIAKGCSKVVNTCGKYSILHSASLVQQATMVITHDTGMMHIAAAFNKKIYSVWGNTVPEFGMYPYLESEQSKRIEVKGLNCRPCSKIGYDKCPKGHFKCMQEIDENLFLSE